MNSNWHADPLVWGHGPTVFEVFLEPTCPFSVKALGKLDALLDQVGEDRLTVKLRLQSQPWHMYSGVIVRCILAASTLENGKAAAKSVMAAVGAHREALEQFELVLEHTDEDPRARWAALLDVGATAWLADDPDRSIDALEEGLGIATVLGDERAKGLLLQQLF